MQRPFRFGVLCEEMGTGETWIAKALYLSHAPRRSLPPAQGRLKRNDYNRAAAYAVTLALGHNRIDAVLRQYLR